MKYIRKQFKVAKRRFKKVSRLFRKRSVEENTVVGLLAISAIVSFTIAGMQEAPKIHTAGLLDIIAEVESRGNYNAHFGNANNTSIQFTSMSIGEVLTWQQEFVEKGNVSSAVGRYQFIDSTLRGLVRELKIDEDAMFNPVLQDKLAVTLLERRGVREYVSNNISKEEFAHNLSKEWAALPKVIGQNPEQSYYAADGMNKALLSVDEIYSGIDTVREL